MVRNTDWYFVSVFGEPSNTGKWGWRFEGHHLSVNYTLDKGEVVVGDAAAVRVEPGRGEGRRRRRGCARCPRSRTTPGR